MNTFLDPEFHFTPPAHWMNDPNGLVYNDGEYHLFYQYHPHSDIWGPMHWGHAVSRDLINWRHLPIALYPDETGMIFSGSAVVDVENTAGFGANALVAVFTYNQDYKESQNLAYSTDRGRTWTKYTGNPVIPPPNPLRDFRDPKVFWHVDHWVMALAAGNSIKFFRSADLKNWERTGTFGGREYGSTIGVWETPDLFMLKVGSTSETRWVLTVGVGNGGPAGGSGTQYFIGEFDGRTFTSENPKETILWADHGPDYYAPQSWSNEPNGRRIMLGWMSNWQYAREIPAGGKRGAMSIPRELSLAQTSQGPRLAHVPVPEFKKIRGERHHWQLETVRPGCSLLKDFSAELFEIIAEFHINGLQRFGFHLRKADEEYTTLRYDAATEMLELDRTHSGVTDFHPTFAAVHSVPLRPVNGIIKLHILVDACSVEVFANDGLLSMTGLIFPSPQSSGLEIFAEGGPVHLHTLDIYHLNPAIYQEEGLTPS